MNGWFITCMIFCKFRNSYEGILFYQVLHEVHFWAPKVFQFDGRLLDCSFQFGISGATVDSDLLLFSDSHKLH